jgi:hypothetical protein
VNTKTRSDKMSKEQKKSFFDELEQSALCMFKLRNAQFI